MKPETPTDPSEVFWMLLTLTALPPEEAMRHLMLDTPARSDPRCLQHATNPLEQLHRALIEYYLGWWDNFEPNCRAAQRLEALCWEIGRSSSDNPPGPFCLEEFVAGESWQQARELALTALREANIEPWPLLEKIDFSEYIEIVSPDDLSSNL